jgi:hypothetical protein
MSTTKDGETRNDALSKASTSTTRKMVTKQATKRGRGSSSGPDGDKERRQEGKSLKRKRLMRNSEPRCEEDSTTIEITATTAIYGETQNGEIYANENHDDDDLNSAMDEEQYEIEKIINHVSYPVRLNPRMTIVSMH